jgi:hypothetical protein
MNDAKSPVCGRTIKVSWITHLHALELLPTIMLTKICCNQPHCPHDHGVLVFFGWGYWGLSVAFGKNML